MPDHANSKRLMATIGAATIMLSLPTPALAEDWGRMLPEMFIPTAAWILCAYSLTVLIAWLFSVFRSQTALNISQVVSAIVTIPALAAIVPYLKYLPQDMAHPQYKRLNRG
jgi:hypothetical protein